MTGVQTCALPIWEAWDVVFQGPVSAVGMTAAIRHPLDVPIEIPLADRAARYVRFTQTGTDPTFYWSVAEFALFAPAR